MSDILDRAREWLTCQGDNPGQPLDLVADLVAEVERARKREQHERDFRCDVECERDDAIARAEKAEADRAALLKVARWAETVRRHSLLHWSDARGSASYQCAFDALPDDLKAEIGSGS